MPGRPEARLPLRRRTRSVRARKCQRVAAGPRPLATVAGAALRGPGDDDPPPIGDPGPDDGESDDDDFDDDDFDDEDAVEAAPARGPRDVV